MRAFGISIGHAQHHLFLRLDLLVPELEKGIDQLVADFIQAGRPSVAGQDIHERRAGYEASTVLAGEACDLYQVKDIQDGDILLRLYKPTAGTDLPVLIYFHGGCFVSGSFTTHEQQLRAIAMESGALVIAVQYRLAPEFTYPAAHDDAYSATEYIKEHCVNWGGNAHNIMLAGDSAGGHIALSTSLRLRDQANWLPQKQILIYPMLDATASSPSYKANGNDFIITAAALTSGFDMYLAGTGLAHDDAQISPLFRDNLAGLPETHILTAEFDPLVDEGESLYKKLRQAGGQAQCRRYMGVIHGFYQLSAVSQAAREAISHIACIIKAPK